MKHLKILIYSILLLAVSGNAFSEPKKAKWHEKKRIAFLVGVNDYEMFWKYTEKFVSSKSLIEIFQSMGLKANYDSYFFCCASGFSGYIQFSINCCTL